MHETVDFCKRKKKFFYLLKVNTELSLETIMVRLISRKKRIRIPYKTDG